MLPLSQPSDQNIHSHVHVCFAFQSFPQLIASLFNEGGAGGQLATTPRRRN
jgi:hypothetical protein